MKKLSNETTNKIIIMLLAAVTVGSLGSALFNWQSTKNTYKDYKDLANSELHLKQELAINAVARARQYDILITLSEKQPAAFKAAADESQKKTDTELLYNMMHLESVPGVKAADQNQSK